MKSNNVDKWINIDAVLHQKLKKLEELNREREELILKAEKESTLSPDMKKELEISLALYTELAQEVSMLKQQAKAIKSDKD